MEQVISYPGTGTPTLASDISFHGDSRRRELAGFLRNRRASLSPEEIGLPRTTRRRVRGLRREEVAEAAGISTAWYTWIEQARDLNISVATLDSISRALHLAEQERAHLFQLAGQPVPSPAVPADDHIMTPLQAMLDGMNPNPAYALNPRWDFVAWNNAASTAFGDLAAMSPGERNYLRLVFTSPHLQNLFVNWEEVARCSLAHFRTDSVALIDDPSWIAMVADLRRRSATFREWWTQHNVAWPLSWRKELRLPDGHRIYNTFDMELSRPSRLRVVTYIPSTQHNAGQHNAGEPTATL
ncbi:MAG: helix-turn-helix transcriptional regulator [Edaphobacter sp.]|uniref:helix-turn-helix transcriptional regulator n=1 Tax=Edaphobacter sp. TaxID=1934404 RepID=UPI002385F54A|nr:helix-turn-helix transcriptional regulator [Edaphobacter sp.]MDE1176880.1 helix-turn-helix transcriptional regulator [Edaphobacter sp.]